MWLRLRLLLLVWGGILAPMHLRRLLLLLLQAVNWLRLLLHILRLLGLLLPRRWRWLHCRC